MTQSPRECDRATYPVFLGMLTCSLLRSHDLNQLQSRYLLLYEMKLQRSHCWHLETHCQKVRALFQRPYVSEGRHCAPMFPSVTLQNPDRPRGDCKAIFIRDLFTHTHTQGRVCGIKEL